MILVGIMLGIWLSGIIQQLVGLDALLCWGQAKCALALAGALFGEFCCVCLIISGAYVLIKA